MRLSRRRKVLNSPIPASTGSATAIGLIYPELKGKLNGVAIRVPLLNASLTDCIFEVERETTVDEVNVLLRHAADGALNGILGFETKPLVVGPVKSNRMQKRGSYSTVRKLDSSKLLMMPLQGFATADPMRLPQVNSQL